MKQTLITTAALLGVLIADLPAMAQIHDDDQSASQDHDVHLTNCAAARAAGAAPIYAGEPGYRRKLDCDGDGVACE